jgi:hypothetical protein
VTWLDFLVGVVVIASLLWALVTLYFARRMRRIIKSFRRDAQ